MLPSDLPSSAALAFLGDAVHTLYVRRRLVAEGISHAKDLNAEALRFEKAVEQEQKILLSVASSMWVSKPITVSHVIAAHLPRAKFYDRRFPGGELS